MHGEGKGEAAGLPALSESTQGMCVAFGTGRGNCGDGMQEQGKWEAGTEANEEEGGEGSNECVTQRQREAQEGAHDDGGGRGRQRHRGGVQGAKGDGGGAAQRAGDADPGVGTGGGEDNGCGGT